MKKLILILFVAMGFATQAQISDALTKDTIDLYILTNNSKSITAAQVNKLLTHLNTNKLHKDSINTVVAWDKNGTYVTLIDTTNFVGINTSTPGYNFDVRGSANFSNGLFHVGFDPGTDAFTVDPVEDGGTWLQSAVDSNYFAGKVRIDSSFVMVNDSTYMGYDPRGLGYDAGAEMSVQIGDTVANVYAIKVANDYTANISSGSSSNIDAYVQVATNQPSDYGQISLQVSDYNGGDLIESSIVLHKDTIWVAADSTIDITSPLTTVNGDLNVTGQVKYDYIHLVAYTTAASYAPNVAANTEFKLVPAFSTTENDGFTFPGDSFTIITPGDYFVIFSTVLQGANGSDWVFKCRKNGVAITTGNLALSTTGAGNYISGAWDWYLLSLAAGDDISFSVTNEGGTDDPTFRSIKVFIEMKPE